MRSRWWIVALVVIALIVIIGLASADHIAASLVAHEFRGRYGDRLQMSGLEVRLFPSIHFSVERIVVPQNDRAGLPPLIAIARATGETGWFAALAHHVRTVRLEGLKIEIPPRRAGALDGWKNPEKPRFVIDQVIADGAVLEIRPKQSGKEPMQFELYRLTVREAGADVPMSFETRMKNVTPPGEIQSAGKFGPWQFGEPAATPVSGDYSFQNADLSVFKGILGTLSATGNYRGVLDRIETDGQTDTPNFALAISGQPVHLTAKFHAIVDGTDGNTYLDPVEGHFGRSTVIARGNVVGGLTAKGRVVTLDATVTNGRLEDLLRLAISSKDVMTGAVSFQSKMVIPPDDVDVAQKLQLDGSFTVDEAHFSKLSVQEKVSELSNRGSGEPQESKDDNIASDFRGRFKLNHGMMTFTGLSFNVPGVRVALDGSYGLVDERLNLHGTATLQAKLSQTTTGWKSVLLKAIDPIFKKKNAGAVLPIKVEGTAKQPRFGLGGG